MIVTLAALLAAALGGVGVLGVRLRRAKRARIAAIRRLAEVVGHPSSMRTPKLAGWTDQRRLADAAAHLLAGMGMVSERRTAAPIVRVQGMAGQYVLTVTTHNVIVEYEAADGVVELGEFPGINGAVREIAAHADRPATV